MSYFHLVVTMLTLRQDKNITYTHSKCVVDGFIQCVSSSQLESYQMLTRKNNFPKFFIHFDQRPIVILFQDFFSPNFSLWVFTVILISIPNWTHTCYQDPESFRLCFLQGCVCCGEFIINVYVSCKIESSGKLSIDQGQPTSMYFFFNLLGVCASL